MLISEWLDAAVSYIKYKPDRADVSEELKAHYEDAKEALMQAGVDEVTARNRAVVSLGDPDAVGKLLAKVHRPLLPRLLKACAAVLAILGFLTFVLGMYRIQVLWEIAKDNRFSPESYIQNWGTDADGWKIATLEDGASEDRAEVGDYTIFVEKAARKTVTTGTGEDHCSVLAILRVKGPVYLDAPWGVSEYITAEDSRGNNYENIVHLPPGGHAAQKLVIGELQTGRWNRNYIIVLVENADPSAEWINLICRREGASFSLNIHFD